MKRLQFYAIIFFALAGTVFLQRDFFGKLVWEYLKFDTIALALNRDADFAVLVGNYYFNGPGGGMYDRARAKKYLELAIARNPNVPLAWHQLARIDFLSRKYADARAKIDRQIALHGDALPNSYYVRGLIDGASYKLEDAETDFKNALEKGDKTHWAIHNDLAWIYFLRGDFKNAEKIAHQGLSYNEGNPWLLNALGLALLNQGKKEALEALTAAEDGMNRLTEADWRTANPGNDPNDAVKDLADMRRIVAYNKALAQGNPTDPALLADIRIGNSKGVSPRGLNGGVIIAACGYSYSQGTYYAYSQGTYYAYSQGTYYAYSQGTYYAYSQGTYYAYSQGTYYAYSQGTYYAYSQGTYYAYSQGAYNVSPTLDPIGDKIVNEGTALTFTVTGRDPDGGTVTLDTTTGVPSGASFPTLTGAQPLSQTFSWTPGFTQEGTYTVTFRVTDPGGLSVTQSITITVNNTNLSPTLNPIGNKTIAEGSGLSFTVSGSDPDGTSVTLSASGLPSGASFPTVTAGGSVSQSFSWTPTFTQAGTYSITFTISDGSLTDTETITITVTNTNLPPVLNPIGNKTIAEGSGLSFTVSGSDPDGTSVTLSASGLPSGASFPTVTAGGSVSQSFSWTPTFTQAGTYSITFTISDGSLTDTETITITVTNTNRPPINVDAGPADLIFVGTPHPHGGATGEDPDEPPTITWIMTDCPTFPTCPTISGATTLTPTYTPNAFGPYTLQLTVSDGEFSMSDTVTETTTNQPPTLDDPAAAGLGIGPKSIAEGSTLTFTVRGNDPDGGIVTVSAITPLPPGAVFPGNTGSVPVDSVFTWTPGFAAGAGSPYSVTFQALDAAGAPVTETISITVTETNQPPTLDDPAIPTPPGIGNRTVNVGSSLTFTVRGADPDGGSVTISSSVPPPTGVTFTPTTGPVPVDVPFSWTPTLAQAGVHSVTFSANDGIAAPTPETITITVNDPFNYSVANPNTTMRQEDTVTTIATITLLAGVKDYISVTNIEGLPPGVTIPFDILTTGCTPLNTVTPCSIPLAITADATVPVGSYSITVITADFNARLSRSTTFVLTIQPPLLVLDSCSALPSTINAGDSVFWEAIVSGGDGHYAYQWKQNAVLTTDTINPVAVTYNVPGTYTRTVRVLSGDGQDTGFDPCDTIEVLAGIISCTVVPTPILPGQLATLSWVTAGFTSGSCLMSNDQNATVDPVPINGSQTVRPLVPTLYTLTCTVGTVTDTCEFAAGVLPHPGTIETPPQ